jgi:purine catabolism regulator
VERLAEAGASGLGIGLGMSGPPLSAALYQRAGELRLPVVTVPYTMPFTAVVRAVAAANAREESRRALLGRLLDRRIDPSAAEPQPAWTWRSACSPWPARTPRAAAPSCTTR